MSAFEKVSEAFKKVQDHIVQAYLNFGEVQFLEDHWTYDKGEGGGRTRVWEDGKFLEKAGVNYSAIRGGTLPPSALANLPKELENQAYSATGVSLVIHPWNPLIPTIHLNIRYFECGPIWWFGGGVDLTPVYTQLDDVVRFHQKLKDFCQSHNEEYTIHKERCDDYFYLPHRGETRGIGGIFFDHLKTDFQKNLDFCIGLGMLFPNLHLPFFHQYADSPYTEEQREFQLYRRSRYVEFNLLFDRGTHFGIQSNGRTESILMSMPARASWRYNWSAPEGTPEAQLEKEFLKPRNWLD